MQCEHSTELVDPTEHAGLRCSRRYLIDMAEHYEKEAALIDAAANAAKAR
jgi:hypothetical protein